MHLIDYIFERLQLTSDTKLYNDKSLKYKKQLDDLLKEEQFKDLNLDEEVWSLWRNASKKEMYLYKTNSYDELLKIWIKSKEDPNENGRYCTFTTSKEKAFNVCSAPPFKKLTLIEK